MSPDLHERIAAAVAEWRAKWSHDDTGIAAFNLAACDHADKVLARHNDSARDGVEQPACPGCFREWPCPEVHDLADLWLGPGWDNERNPEHDRTWSVDS